MLDVDALVAQAGTDPAARAELSQSETVWSGIEDLLTRGTLETNGFVLITNISISEKANQLAWKFKIQQSLVQNVDKYCGIRQFWTALSNSSQTVRLDVDEHLVTKMTEKLQEFPIPILRLCHAIVRNHLEFLPPLQPFFSAILRHYPKWHGTEPSDLILTILYDMLGAGKICKLVDLYKDTTDIELLVDLMRALDAILVNASPFDARQTLGLQILGIYKKAVSNGPNFFSVKSTEAECWWNLLILCPEALKQLLEMDQDLKHVLYTHGCVSTVVELLKECKKLPTFSKLNESKEPEPQDFPMVKSSAISLLSLMVVKNEDAQDYVRDNGALGLVLECCVIDNNNPYIRERAIVCIKFLLEGNMKNQEFVASLEAKQVVNPEILEKAGFETEIVNGKISIKQHEPKIKEVE